MEYTEKRDVLVNEFHDFIQKLESCELHYTLQQEQGLQKNNNQPYVKMRLRPYLEKQTIWGIKYYYIDHLNQRGKIQDNLICLSVTPNSISLYTEFTHVDRFVSKNYLRFNNITRFRERMLNVFPDRVKEKVNKWMDEFIRTFFYVKYDKEFIKNLPLSFFNTNWPVSRALILDPNIKSFKDIVNRYYISGQKRFQLNKPVFVINIFEASKVFKNPAEFCDFIKKHEQEFNEFIKDKNKLRKLDVILFYYNCKVRPNEFKEIKRTIRDLYNMFSEISKYSNDEDAKFSNYINSVNGLQREHDRIMFNMHTVLSKISSEPLNVHPIFREVLPEQFLLIDDVRALKIEGEQQNHCVFSRRGPVEMGNCAIYTTIYNGRKYTIELNKVSATEVGLGEMRGRFNTLPPEGLKSEIKEYIKKFNKKPKKYKTTNWKKSKKKNKTTTGMTGSTTPEIVIDENEFVENW